MTREERQVYTEEFYNLFGGKELLVVKAPYGFRELKRGDVIYISRGGLVGEHITHAYSYVDIQHEAGLPRLSTEVEKLFPKDFIDEDKYYQDAESRQFVGKTDWQLYEMYQSIKEGGLVFTERHKFKSNMFCSFVEQFLEEDEYDY